jgi:(2Fe-2S) ferredoxin
MKRFEKHIFVCENKRPDGHPRGCCADKGSLEFRQALKKRIKKLGLNSKIRINSAGCLDACEYGAVMVVYPEQIWYGNVTINDIDDIIDQQILNNQPVKRLTIKNKEFNKDDNNN